MDISLEDETLQIYRKELETLIQREEKYASLGAPELAAIADAFKLTLTHGREKIRPQVIYDRIHEKRDD